MHTEDPESRQEWLDIKDSLGLDFPNLPYFFHGKTKLSEHLAIHEYICE